MALEGGLPWYPAEVLANWGVWLWNWTHPVPSHWFWVVGCFSVALGSAHRFCYEQDLMKGVGLLPRKRFERAVARDQ